MAKVMRGGPKRNHYRTLPVIFAAFCLGLTLIIFVEDGIAGLKKAILVNVEQQALYTVDNYKIIYGFDVIIGQPGKEIHAGKVCGLKKTKITRTTQTKA